jgi:hypothetical protein
VLFLFLLLQNVYGFLMGMDRHFQPYRKEARKLKKREERARSRRNKEGRQRKGRETR